MQTDDGDTPERRPSVNLKFTKSPLEVDMALQDSAVKEQPQINITEVSIIPTHGVLCV